MVVAQVWRDRQGRQVNLARLLRTVDVRAIDERAGRQAGVLLGMAGTADRVDATVVLLAGPGDRILTSDPDHIGALAVAAANRAVVVTC
jgi:DNA-binding transcriptional MocR family regulator